MTQLERYQSPSPTEFHIVLEQREHPITTPEISKFTVDTGTNDLAAIQQQIKQFGQQDQQTQRETDDQFYQRIDKIDAPFQRTANSGFAGLVIAGITIGILESPIAPVAIHALGTVAPVLVPLLISSPVGAAIGIGVASAVAIRTIWGIGAAIKHHQGQLQPAKI
jgi:hypothetical protein